MFTLKITVKARYGHEQMPSERTVSIPVDVKFSLPTPLKHIVVAEV